MVLRTHDDTGSFVAAIPVLGSVKINTVVLSVKGTQGDMARRSMLIFVHSLSMPIVTFSSALGNLDSGIWYCSLSYHFWSDYGLVCNTSTVQAPSCRVLSRGDNSPVQLTPCQQHRIAVLYML